ncbi:NADPH-dependent aldo-keto reductase, chloroplastic isoform X1 [Cryptomeria japonica]|uniref:NADPH-dependent aldo-keto reductase, chloroplastic isoform X1 n=2 Tax=Cryptomeria japonica TaxID=3369 RepID=UPI0025AC54C0|nr:NADPH-dependent aldo-keto reductase, chloroplastic isoform X1 [Cryptomeria japonica]
MVAGNIMGIVGGSAELNTGARIPLIGLGTAAITQNEEEIIAAVTAALQVGYRHFDTARLYRSEHALGKALNSAFQSGLVSREDVFVTTKLKNTEHDDPVAAIKDSLMNMQLEYVDLFLIHWPIKLRAEIPLAPVKEEDFLPLDIKSTWQAMEQCMEMGLTKAIGVSNFSSKKIEDLLNYAKIPPAVDQVEMHPQWQQKKLRDYCNKHSIHVSAWSPLGAPNTPWGSNEVIDNPLILEIAQKHGKTRAQVILRWGIEQGVSVLPKSYNTGRITENFQIFDWSLTPDDHDMISKLEQRKLLRGDNFVNSTTSPYKTVEELWDGEI